MGQRKALVKEVNPHLICVLCNGYFIEATTIIECLHSFCRSCLIKYLEHSKFCPVCEVQLHKNNPLQSVRCDQVLQQLVYKLIPGLYAKEMARRRKYYSELGGPSSDPEVEYPIPDAYFSPTDCISLSLEFNAGPKEDDLGHDSDFDAADKQGLHHRRYLQCPAAVTMCHLKKFLKMKYDLNSAYSVEIIYDGELLTDEFTLMDVAYSFNWNKTSPMRFQFRLFQKQLVNKVQTKPEKHQLIEKKVEQVEQNEEEFTGQDERNVEDDEDVEARLEEEEANERLEEEEANNALQDEEANDRLEEEEAQQTLEDETMERLEEDEVNQRIEEEALLAEEAIMEEIDEEEEDDDIQVIMEEELAPPQNAINKKVERINGLKRHHNFDENKREDDVKKLKRSPSPKIESANFKRDEKQFIEEMIVEEDTDEDRLRISASEEEKSPDPPTPVEHVLDEKPKSEERRKERKKSKKGKHHHHHRHHDKKKGESPPAAEIVHSPENDVMKLKVKLTAIKNCDNMVKGYSVVDEGERRKDYKNHYHIMKSETCFEKTERRRAKEQDSKKPEACKNNNNNNNNVNNNNNNNGDNSSLNHSEDNASDSNSSNNTNHVANNSNEVNHGNNTNHLPNNPPTNNVVNHLARTPEINKETPNTVRPMRKVPPKTNGALKPEPMKMPPSSITVSKITAAEKRQMEQQKLLMNRSQTNGLDPKRPSLEIMLVNAPKKLEQETPKPEVKKVIRPTPPSIPLSRLPKGLVGVAKANMPPLRAVRTVPEEALDLSGKSSRKSPDCIDPLKIPILQKAPPPYAVPARPCKPNPTVRQIPNPSALLFRQNSMNGRALPPPGVPISSLRHMESMTKKIEKVTANLPLKPPNGLYMAK